MNGGKHQIRFDQSGDYLGQHYQRGEHVGRRHVNRGRRSDREATGSSGNMHTREESRASVVEEKLTCPYTDG